MQDKFVGVKEEVPSVLPSVFSEVFWQILTAPSHLSLALNSMLNNYCILNKIEIKLKLITPSKIVNFHKIFDFQIYIRNSEYIYL